MPTRTLELILAALALLGSFAIHLFFPVIPFVKLDFELSDALAQLTFSIGVFGMAFFYPCIRYIRGPLRPPSSAADRPAFLSLGKHHLGVCNSFAGLLVCRFSVHWGRVRNYFGRAIARDVYGAERLVKINCLSNDVLRDRWTACACRRRVFD